MIIQYRLIVPCLRQRWGNTKTIQMKINTQPKRVIQRTEFVFSPFYFTRTKHTTGYFYFYFFRKKTNDGVALSVRH